MCSCKRAATIAALALVPFLFLPTSARALVSAGGSGLPALNQDFPAEEDDVEECSEESADDASEAAGDYAKQCIKQCSPNAARVECSVSQATDFHSVSHSFLGITWTNVACTRHVSCTCECILPQGTTGMMIGSRSGESVVILNGEEFSAAEFFGLIGAKEDGASGTQDRIQPNLESTRRR